MVIVQRRGEPLHVHIELIERNSIDPGLQSEQIGNGGPVGVDERPHERAQEVYETFISDSDDGGGRQDGVRVSGRVVGSSRECDGNAAALLHLRNKVSKLLESTYLAAQDVLLRQEVHEESELVPEIPQQDASASLESILVSEGVEGDSHDGLMHEEVHETVTVVGQHKDVFEVRFSTQRHLENIFLVFRNDVRHQVERRFQQHLSTHGVIVAPDARAAPQDLLSQPLNAVRQQLLADASAVVQQNRRHNVRRSYYYFLCQAVDYLVT